MMLSIYDYIGRWGFWGGGSDQVHPDDVKIWRGMYGKIFHCRGITKDGYLVIKYGEYIIRVQPSTYSVTAPLDFYIDDFVIIKKHPEQTAQIREVGWHHNRGEPMFRLWVDGKKKSRTYFKDELERKGWG